MIASVSSPPTVSTTRPRIWAILYGCSWSTIEIATRGSASRLRALREPGLGEERDPLALERDPDRDAVRPAVREHGRDVGELGAPESRADAVGELCRAADR